MPKKQKKAKRPDRLELLIESLDFSVETLLDTLQNQPRLFHEACLYRVEKIRARAAADAELSEARVAAAQTLRHDAEQGGYKVTVQQVEEGVSGNPEVKSLAKAAADARAEEEYAKLVLECYYQRSAMARAMAQLAGNEGLVGSGAADAVAAGMGGAELRKRVREKYGE